MSLIGFASTSPETVRTVLAAADPAWNVIMYVPGPTAERDYRQQFKAAKAKGGKICQLVVDSRNLAKVKRKVDATCVFDSFLGLAELQNPLPLKIVDCELVTDAVYKRKPLKAAALLKLVDGPGRLPEKLPLLGGGPAFRNRPLLHETTSAIAPKTSGIRGQMAEVIALCGEQLPPDLDSTLAHFIFGLIKKTKVTTLATKKMPEKAKAVWMQVLSFADSAVGLQFRSDFQALCSAKNYQQALAKLKVDKKYAGDWEWLTTICRPSPVFEFVAAAVPPVEKNSGKGKGKKAKAEKTPAKGKPSKTNSKKTAKKKGKSK